jgi:hypothetical protein
LTEEQVLERTSNKGVILAEERVLDGASDEGRVLDGVDNDKDGSAGVKGLKERYWMRFLKGMVTDRNRGPCDDKKSNPD